MRRTNKLARVGIIVLYENESEGTEQYSRFATRVSQLGACQPVPFLLQEGEQLAAGVLADLDGVLVAGGLTPAYLAAVTVARDEIRALVADGVPYLGFSAGAAIAARRAIIGGWKWGSVAICHEDNAESLDQLTVANGLGLVDFAVDVHAAQWGNVSRLLMAVATGGVDLGVALDENSVLIVEGEAHRLSGAGQAWWARRSADGLVVQLEP